MNSLLNKFMIELSLNLCDHVRPLYKCPHLKIGLTFYFYSQFCPLTPITLPLSVFKSLKSDFELKNYFYRIN